MTGIKTVIVTAALLIGASQLVMAQGDNRGTPGSSGPPPPGTSQGGSGQAPGSSGATAPGTTNH